MMKINVKLFSVLRQYVAGYDAERGLDVELAPGMMVRDLIGRLGIPEDKAPVVSCEGRILKHSDLLRDGSVLHIFQPVSGG